MITTLHLLRAGKPLCGLLGDAPRDWPEGNRWMPFNWADGGLSGEMGILTREISDPKVWRACRGCAKGSLDVLISLSWKWREGESFETLLEKFGLSPEPATDKVEVLGMDDVDAEEWE